MTILDRHASDSQRIHECGGTILYTAGNDDPMHYCDRCGAFAYGGRQIPSGSNEDANREAFDAGDEASPAG